MPPAVPLAGREFQTKFLLALIESKYEEEKLSFFLFPGKQ
jgi:hypothetical protein